MYKKAKEYSHDGLLFLLTEEQFFDILEGKTIPPEKPELGKDVIVIPAANSETYEREMEQKKKDMLNRKRMASMAKHGIPPQDGLVRADLRPFHKTVRMMEILKEQNKSNPQDES